MEGGINNTGGKPVTNQKRSRTMIGLTHSAEGTSHRFFYGPFQLELSPQDATDKQPERLVISIRRALNDESEIVYVDDILNPPAEPFAWVSLTEHGASFRRWDADQLSIRKFAEIRVS
jgi:hypothetical protein